MQQGRYFKQGSRQVDIAAFQLVGYSAWNGEDTGSNPVCYTIAYATGLVVQRPAQQISEWTVFDARLSRKWFVGVMANMFDCLSKVMSSILIRTANPE